jgi:hypothetical protein
LVDRPPDAAPPDRIEHHRAIAAELQAATDDELVRRLAGTPLSPRGHGVLPMPRSNAQIFLKLLPLTDLELQPEHRQSTANIFGLPTYYQYRLGGFGFGSWRELEVHRLTNEWVLSGQCVRFPLLHHWRVLPIPPGRMDNLFESWGNDAGIRRRVCSIDGATWSLVLFLEHFPQTTGWRSRARSISTGMNGSFSGNTRPSIGARCSPASSTRSSPATTQEPTGAGRCAK